MALSSKKVTAVATPLTSAQATAKTRAQSAPSTSSAASSVRDEPAILVDRGVKLEADAIARDIPRLVDDYLPKKLFDSDLVKL
jgi:hypothetical protein